MGMTVEAGAGVVVMTTPGTTTVPVTYIADMVATPAVADTPSMGAMTTEGISKSPLSAAWISGGSGSWGSEGAMLLVVVRTWIQEWQGK